MFDAETIELIRSPHHYRARTWRTCELDDNGRITGAYMDVSSFEEYKVMNAQGPVETKGGSFDPTVARQVTLFAIGYIEGSSDGERRKLNKFSVHR
jgi:hypothetical protein